jgi:hypothetical protein
MLISRGLMVHRASTDMSTMDTVSERIPTIATRLADAVGWIIVGAVPMLGSRLIRPIRSCTSWRAR